VRPWNVRNYELVRSLGIGGMAETFEAIRRGPAGFSQRVCLKRMLPQRLAEPSAVELFLDEARLSAHLRCASIAQVLDFGEADGEYYMALELVEGENLETLLRGLNERGGRLSPAVITYVAAELLGALDYAHTLVHEGAPLGIVHRDVSPSNVLVSVRGEVKLTDFGIAKARGRTHRTRSGSTKGKLAYMSPEQARAEPLDGRSDLFSLGILLYELLTGLHPFEATTELELIQKIMDARYVPLEQVAPEAPIELRVVVECLLRADPARRLATAGEALRLLPFTGSPYLAQAELAEVVSAHRRGVLAAKRAPVAEPTRTAPIVSGSAETEPVSAATYQPANGTGDATRRRRVPFVRIALAVLGVVLAITGVLALRSPESTPSAPVGAAPRERPAPMPEPPSTPEPLPVRDAAASAPAPVAEEDVAPVEPSAAKKPAARRPAVRAPQKPPEPDAPAKAPERKRTRSGAEVRPEEFL
jgi:serine/threonine protein kinase